MALQTDKNGHNVSMLCDLCGKPTKHLRKVPGKWVNSKTGRKIAEGSGWLCPYCAGLVRDGKA